MFQFSATQLNAVLTNQIELFNHHGYGDYQYQAKELRLGTYVHHKRASTEKRETRRSLCLQDQMDNDLHLELVSYDTGFTFAELSPSVEDSTEGNIHPTVDEVFQSYALADRSGAQWNTWREANFVSCNPKRSAWPPRKPRQPYAQLVLDIHEEWMEIICSTLEDASLLSI